MRKNHAHFLHVFIVICCLCCIPASQAQNYGEKLNNHWRGILGLQKEDGAYQWFAYPADNFGVMTIYGPSSQNQLTDASRICSTWTCLGVDPAKIPTDEFRFTTVMGFANARLRSQIELVNNKDGRAAIALLLSNLFHALDIAGTVSISKTASLDLRASQMYRRSINLPNFRDFLESSPNPELRDARSRGQLTYIGADIVARGLQLTIDVDPEKDPSTDAQFTQAIARLGRDGSSGVRVSRPWHGTYLVQFSEFVVLATQFRHESGSPMHLGNKPATAGHPQQFADSKSTIPAPRENPRTLCVTGE